MPWKRLEDIFEGSLEDVLKTSRRHLEGVFKTSWRRLEDAWKRSWRRLENVLKTTKGVLKTSSRRLHQDECLLGRASLHMLFFKIFLLGHYLDTIWTITKSQYSKSLQKLQVCNDTLVAHSLNSPEKNFLNISFTKRKFVLSIYLTKIYWIFRRMQNLKSLY